MKHAKLPKFLQPKGQDNLIRLGRDFDGGYIVEIKDVQNADCLLGLGINDDWSFERDFLAINDVELLAFDASVNSSVFLKKSLQALPVFFKPKNFKRLFLFLEYHLFFRRKRRHIKSHVGLDSPPNSVPMNHLFEMMKVKKLNKAFMKIDIEGSEYRILEDLIENAKVTTGLAIEFHDCNAHLDEIRDFVDRYPLHLAHIHANNFAPLTDDGLPLVMELTFSSQLPNKNEVRLPHPGDMPNSKRREDILCRFGS